MIKEGYTVLKQAEVSFEERRSVFICNIKRIKDEKEAMDFINSIKEKYKDATHNVYAYITNNKISMRYSDDGEPQGTAGPPVLEVLKREGVDDVAAVVTRYFGGILLGAGGLIRAYGASCKQGLDAACKVKRLLCMSINISCDYEKYGKLNNYLQRENVLIKNVDFTEIVKLHIICLKKDIERIRGDIIEMMYGNDGIDVLGEMLCFVDDEEKIMDVMD